MIHPKTQVSTHDVSTHYNELDHYYRMIWGEHVHHGLWHEDSESVEQAVENLSHRVAQELLVNNISRVCDIGCGYGATSQIMADNYGAHVTGLTISETQFSIANQRLSRNGSLEFQLQDWLANDLRSDHFDSAYAIESSEHMPDKRKFFAEMHRVLKPGARFVICAWCSSENPSRLAKRWLLEPICEEGRIPSLLTAREYLKLAEDEGFSDLRAEDITKSVQETWSLIVKKTIAHFWKNPHHLKDFLPGHLPSVEFLPSVARIAIAYRTGAMEYVFFSGKKS